MKRSDFARSLVYVVAALLAACGGSQRPIAAPGAMTQSPSIAAPARLPASG